MGCWRDVSQLFDPIELPLMNNIPIIDFQKFDSGDVASRLSIASAVHKAASEVGFMYVRNLVVDDSIVAEAFRSSAQFFA